MLEEGGVLGGEGGREFAEVEGGEAFGHEYVSNSFLPAL